MPRPGNSSSQPLDQLRAMDLEEHLGDPAVRQRFVTTLFDVVARRYDRFTQVFSFGMDRGWKRQLMEWLAARLPQGGAVLDLACGTGDLAFGAVSSVPEGSAVGIDASRAMVRMARQRARLTRGQSCFLVGDLMSLPVGDGMANVVTVGYGLRNAPDLLGALEEVRRVLVAGGWLLTLDFYLPERGPLRRAFLTHLRLAGAAAGWWWHREPVVYAYIAASLERYVTHRAFTQSLVAHGFVVEEVQPKLYGGICLHAARKE